MTGLLLIRDLAVVLLIAGAAAWVCRRLGLSAIVGYLLAGAVVGPYTPPFALVADLERVQTLAQLGLVFVIFAVGLNLSISRLKRMGLSVVLATGVAAILVLNGGRVLGWSTGWDGTASLFLAGMLMVSSSAIISKVLDELNQSHERHGQLALGMTVLEDVVAILMLTLLTSLVRLGGGTPPLVSTLGGLGAFVVFIVLVSLRFLPGLLARVSRGAPPEVRTLLVAGLVLALAWLAARAGYSPALGAFLLGAILGGTRFKAAIERSFEGLHQVFGAVFFVAVGMLVDFRLLREAWPLVLALSAAALLLRPAACALGFLAVGNNGREAVLAGLCLAPLGEFSFIIAQLGVDGGILPPTAYPAAVGASLVTSLAAPLLMRHSAGIQARLARLAPLSAQRGVAFYHDWLARLRVRQGESLLWRLTHRRFLQVGVLMLFITALMLFANPLYARARAYGGGTGPTFPLLFWNVLGLLILAPLIAVWRNLAALSMILAEAATSGARKQRRLQLLLETALRAVATVVLGAWLIALLPPGEHRARLAGAVGAMLAVVAAVFWRRFVRLHGRAEIEIARHFRDASHPAGASAWSSALPRQTAGWLLDLEEVAVPADSAHAGRTLSEIGLRKHFGCSVVGIDRQGHGIVNPSADARVYPGDKLLLLGNPEQLAPAAREAARFSATAGGAGFDELTLESVVVPGGCGCAGKTLVELDLIRRAGVQIGGIRRAGRVMAAPTGRDHLESGDELLVLGTHAQIRAFARLLHPDGDEGV
jgi:CPA2 family monovalent cation:H+ antiporter-2